MGADGWVVGLFASFPKETVAIWKLVQVGRLDEALAIYRWFGPWFDLDISTNLFQNIKLAESFAIDTKDRVRAPRLPLEGSERQRIAAIIEKALATRLVLPTF